MSEPVVNSETLVCPKCGKDWARWNKDSGDAGFFCGSTLTGSHFRQSDRCEADELRHERDALITEIARLTAALAAETERCAMICEESAKDWGNPMFRDVILSLAGAIRCGNS